jgi:hypothetical protein
MSAPPGTPSTIISKENIRVAAETVGVELSEDVVKALCHEVEYRVREITQVRLGSFIFCAITLKWSVLIDAQD